MTDPRIVSREEWLAARKKLLDREKELTRQRDAVNTELRMLPMVEIDEDYTFDGPDGTVGLLDLFDGRRQLLVYHFMFDPSWNEGCESCSYVMDNVGHLAHLHARNTSFAIVSRAPYATLAGYRSRMGWDLPWYSAGDGDFNYDFHTTLDPSRAPVEYNYRPVDATADGAEWPEESHGVSAFLRQGDRLFHTYSSYARGVELLAGTNVWLDMTALGRQEDWEQPPGRADGPMMSWLRRHDEYDQAAPAR